ncbi:MAG: PH domain-containing protein [bacterium]|nr:PH domain-containing protein [bacterium]
MFKHFLGQHEKETIIAVTRPHWIVFLGSAGTSFILVLAVPLALLLLNISIPQILEGAAQDILWLLAALWLYAVWAFTFLSWSKYWFDVAIITTERIVKIDQHDIFHREISEFLISRVQDVRVEIKGALATTLKFGDLVVGTAGEGPAFTFKTIPHPERVKDIILYHQKAGSTGQVP